ncbi:apolipoprotein N-acyltransferase [Methylopila jiangsuensis]|uniref:Apolipoprotein N-acyltransferase n=1 Tax=Methylopila jiangsuensis TaxID=586230 RepID=A0A9W6JHW6_9HYPH|nr:apolipoprotein N-acyltransferase [Methylopila jiangsuensis]MDR6285106.1 apolipoprotein N-acyltransferase [Methylopila jiangsuensis]GLK77507.1 apolipoprotein N-acyltransferase [Methylopila jiangsuensis]
MTRRSPLAALAQTVTLANGWRRVMIAFSAGAASALAMPPLSLWPVLALSFPVAVFLIDGAAGATRGRTILSAAVAGWWFGFGYFLGGLWWIGSAFLVDADIFGWLMPLGVAGLPAGLALFPAAGFALARALWSGGGRRVFAFAGALGLAETLRGHVLTGFPWNAFGYALADQSWFGQFASVVGVEGLTFIALAVFAAPAALVGPRPAWRGAAAAALTLAGLAAFGAGRLALGPTEYDPRVTVRAIQPEIPQDIKTQEAQRDVVMDAYLALSDEARGPESRGLADATLTVWPESAFPFILSRTPEALSRIGASLAPGATLATGAVRGELRPDGTPQFWNALHLVGDDGAIHATYDKLHLVPFGEYLPFQALLEAVGLQQLTRLQGGFSAGDRATLIALPQGPRFRALICYEAIFPGEIAGGERPDFLLNVTNDAWFGHTPGPLQHAAQARVRAIEQGLPLVRSANGGVSMVVDAYGRVLAALPLGQRGVVDSRLPLKIAPTIYDTTRGMLFLLFPIVFMLAAVLRRRSV